MKYINFYTLRKYMYQVLYLITVKFTGNKISVLCFHDISNSTNRYAISKKQFTNIIEKISKHSEFISIDEALSGKKVKKSSVVISFDDGYSSILDLLPLFSKYHIKPIAFVLADHKLANRKELDNKSQLLNINGLKKIQKFGVDIGSHTLTHADLTNMNTKQLEKEIINSKNMLEKKLNMKINYFAYPKGKYNENVIKVVEKAKYKAAFSIEPGNINKKINKFTLPRTIIDKTHEIDEFPAIYFPSSYMIRNIANKFNLWERLLN